MLTFLLANFILAVNSVVQIGTCRQQCSPNELSMGLHISNIVQYNMTNIPYAFFIKMKESHIGCFRNAWEV